MTQRFNLKAVSLLTAASVVGANLGCRHVTCTAPYTDCNFGSKPHPVPAPVPSDPPVVDSPKDTPPIPISNGDSPSELLQRIAFGSCIDQNKSQEIWSTVLAAEPDLFLMLGDNVYADTEDMDKMRADYEKLGSVPAFAELRESCPILATWDDHDYGKNDAGAEYPKKRESQQIMLEFFHEPASSPRWTREGVYGSQTFGPAGRRVQVILLDTRYHRGSLVKRPADDPPPLDRFGPYLACLDTNVTMLGEAQWIWLGEQLRQPAELRFLVSSIQLVAEDHGFEKWANLPHERERLFRTIRETGAKGVIVLSGDRHMAELSREDGAVGYPLYDLTSSALNRPRAWTPEINKHRVKNDLFGSAYYDPNFGMILIDWDRADPQITLQIRSREGKPVICHELAMSALR